MPRPRPENPLYIAQRDGQRPREQRRGIGRSNGTVACSGARILCNELLRLAACLVEGVRDGHTTGGAGIAGIQDVGTRADSRRDDNHTVEVVQQQEGVHEVDQVCEEVGEGERRGGPEEGVRVDDDHDEADVIGVELGVSGGHGRRGGLLLLAARRQRPVARPANSKLRGAGGGARLSAGAAAWQTGSSEAQQGRAAVCYLAGWGGGVAARERGTGRRRDNEGEGGGAASVGARTREAACERGRGRRRVGMATGIPVR